MRGKAGMHMKFTVSVPNVETDENARELRQWFQKEWDGYEKKRGDTRNVVTKTLYRIPVSAEQNVDKSIEARNAGGWESNEEGSSISRTLSFRSSQQLTDSD